MRQRPVVLLLAQLIVFLIAFWWSLSLLINGEMGMKRGICVIDVLLALDTSDQHVDDIAQILGASPGRVGHYLNSLRNNGLAEGPSGSDNVWRLTARGEERQGAILAVRLDEKMRKRLLRALDGTEPLVPADMPSLARWADSSILTWPFLPNWEARAAWLLMCKLTGVQIERERTPDTPAPVAQRVASRGDGKAFTSPCVRKAEAARHVRMDAWSEPEMLRGVLERLEAFAILARDEAPTMAEIDEVLGFARSVRERMGKRPACHCDACGGGPMACTGREGGPVVALNRL